MNGFEGLGRYPCIFSFSELDNDLRQWIPYADNAKGVALGFSRAVGKRWEQFCPRTVVYDTNYDSDFKKTKYLKEYFHESLKVLSEMLEAHPKYADELHMQHYISMFEHITSDIIACKDENYKEEKEWRISVSADNKMKKKFNFSVKEKLLKPYMEIPFHRSFLSEIILGPLCDDINKKSLELLLVKYGYGKVKIRHSDIPYRG